MVMRLQPVPWRQLMIAAGLLVLSAHCQADAYKCLDSKGMIHLTNSRENCRGVIKTLVQLPPLSQHKPKPEDPAVAALQFNLPKPKVKSKPRAIGVNDANRRYYAGAINQIAGQYGLDPNLMHAVISAESGYNPNAVSPAGAMGIMQLMPATAQRFGVADPYDPVANMHGGARYLRFLINLFNDLNLALAAYNAGENAVARYGNSIPPYSETQTYVTRVRQFYDHYRISRLN